MLWHHRRKLGVIVFLVACAGLASIWITQTSAAGPSISLTTSPVSLDLHITPGSAATQTLQFRNNSSIALPITTEVKIFGPYGSSGEAAITNPGRGNMSTDWVSLSPANFVAQPNVWTAVKMTIKLPPSANLGYYYAVVFQPTLPSQTNTRSTTIKGSNAILVLVDTNSANERREVQVSSFSANKHIYEYLPVTFNITIHNGGNIFLAPTGDIFISRHSNMTHSIASIPVNQGGGNVLPNSNRIFSADWADGFPVFKQKQLDGQPLVNSKGQPVDQLVWNFSQANHFRFGKYYAQLALVYNDGAGNKLVTSEVSFWVIPWWLLIGGLVILILVGVGIWSIGRVLFSKSKFLTKRRR